MAPLYRTFLICLVILSFSLATSALRPISPSRSVVPSQPTPTVHVFLCAGQSNSVGVNTDPKLPEDAPNPRIPQLVTCADSQLLNYLPFDKMYLNTSIDPLIPCQGGNLSAWRSFSRTLLPHLPAEDVILLVPTGYGGTGFINGNWNAYTGGGFQFAVQALLRAWALLGEGQYAKYNKIFAGIGWHQGEADAGDNPKGLFANSSTYIFDFMKPMVEAFRNTTLLPFTRHDLPLMAGAMLESWVDNSSYPLRQGVKVGSATLTQYIPYTGYASSLGLVGDVNKRDPDGELIHFTAASQRLFGKRYYAAYQAALVNYPLPPKQSGGDEAAKA